MSQPIRLLNVNDNEITRYVITRTLRKAGYEVVEAVTGLEGLQRASEAFDLIVLDVHLPDINGYTLCQQMKQLPQHAETPVLLISAALSETSIDKGLDLCGADAALGGTFREDRLLEAVQRLLQKKRSCAA